MGVFLYVWRGVHVWVLFVGEYMYMHVSRYVCVHLYMCLSSCMCMTGMVRMSGDRLGSEGWEGGGGRGGKVKECIHEHYKVFLSCIC